MMASTHIRSNPAMTDTETTSKRASIAERDWIDAESVVTKDEAKATGFRYIWRATKREYKYQIPNAQPGTPQTMLAVFGGMNKAASLANSWKDLDPTERGTDPIDYVADWFKRVEAGEPWSNAGSGLTGGPKYDWDKLVQALTTVTGKAADYFEPKKDLKVNQSDGKAAADPKAKGAIFYGTYALRNPDVRKAYDALVPATNAPTVEAL